MVTPLLSGNTKAINKARKVILVGVGLVKIAGRNYSSVTVIFCTVQNMDRRQGINDRLRLFGNRWNYNGWN